MNHYLLYFIIILLANTVGSLSGMGGGVIIKPALDTIGLHNLASINFYSSVAVFVMSIVSIYRQIKGGFRINFFMTIIIASGSLVGGFFGNIFFQKLLQYFSNEKYVQLVQIAITVIVLSFVFLYTRWGSKTYNLKNIFWVFVVGFFLGFMSTLLGIGGGPINVSLLVVAFSMNIKEATVYSIATIFFSQISKLVSVQLNEGFFSYDLKFFIPIIPAAILGGILGAKLNQQLDIDKIRLLFQVITLFVIFLNIYNGLTLLF